MSPRASQPGDRVPDPIFPPSTSDEVAEELRFHLEMRARELVARGMTPAAAERAAREQFADLDHVRDECRRLARQREQSTRRTNYLAHLRQDVHFALRMLRQRPGFAFMAILPIALGIGAATAMYSVADSVLLRPLPFPHPEELVAVWATEGTWREHPTVIPWNSVVIGKAEYDALTERARTLRPVAAWGRAGVALVENGTIEALDAVRVTANLLPMLGVRPVLGRGFLAEENVLDGPRVAMLGWEAWQKRFGGDSSIVGRSVAFDTRRYTVVGIVPPGVRLDRTVPPPAVWLPAFRDSSDRVSQHNRSYRGLARLAPGMTLQQANAEVARILRDVKTEWKGTDDGTAGRAVNWQADQTAATRPSLLMLSGAVGLLLLIACVNVATLMLGESARREPEISARRALGASPARLAQQLLTESIVIAAVGAVIGALLAKAGVAALVAAAPGKIPGLTDARVDLRVLLFTAVCAMAIGIGFGLVPALATWRGAGGRTVRIGAGQSTRGAGIMQRTLVAAEVGLSLVMLVGCSLLGRSLIRLSTVDPGFVSEGLLQVDLVTRSAFWRDDARMDRFFTAAARELRTIPGVEAVSGSSSAPFSGGTSSSAIKVEGRSYVDDGPNIQQQVVMPGYFRTLRLPIVAGRDFSDDDRLGGERVAILSRAAVQRDWGGRSPIGGHVEWQDERWTVIGVAGDVRHDQLSDAAAPIIYVPSAQMPGSGMGLEIRASADVRALEAVVRQRLAPLDANVQVDRLTPVATLIGRSHAEESYRTALGSLFGVLAAILAGVGMFGVISRTVARRMHEAGIRVALGAPAAAVTGLMLRETLTGAAIGIALGLPVAILLARGLTPYLYGVRPADPVAYGLAFVLLAATTALATLPPARRAGKVDPVMVLRAE